jgi:hypothetical protein
MSMNFRVLPPTIVTKQTMNINGRNYSGAPGVAMDVVDFDAQVLTANGWIFIAPSGPTSARPSPRAGATPGYIAALGSDFWDTTLNKYVVFDGAAWRDPATGNAV